MLVGSPSRRGRCQSCPTGLGRRARRRRSSYCAALDGRSTSPSLAGGQLGHLTQGGAVADGDPGGRSRRPSRGRRRSQASTARTAPRTPLVAGESAAGCRRAERSRPARSPASGPGERSWPVGFGVVALRRPANSICRAIAPATATAMPLTMRAAVPLLSCSLRTASCQDDRARPRRATTASTTHGSSAVTPTSSRMTPPVTMVLVEVAVVRGPCRSSGRACRGRPAAAAAATTAGVGGLGRTHHAERFDHHAAQREQRDQHGGRRDRDGDQDGEYGRGVEVAREDADRRTVRRSPAIWRPIRKKPVPKTSPSKAPASASPAAIRRVIRLSAPTSRSAASLPVAPLAAEAYGRGDEHADRHQQHHEDRRGRAGAGPGPSPSRAASGSPNGVDARDAGVVVVVLGQVLGRRV